MEDGDGCSPAHPSEQGRAFLVDNHPGAIILSRQRLARTTYCGAERDRSGTAPLRDESRGANGLSALVCRPVQRSGSELVWRM